MFCGDPSCAVIAAVSLLTENSKVNQNIDRQHNESQHNDNQHNDSQHNDRQHNGLNCDTQHKSKNVPSSAIHYAECSCAGKVCQGHKTLACCENQ
jgi:hypothetical protein